MSVYQHPEWLALLRAILAEPADDTARLVAADWLDEHGEGERAEFVRAQVTLARWERFPGEQFFVKLDSGDTYDFCPGGVNLAALRRRERELLEAHEQEWRGPVLRRTGLWDEPGSDDRPPGTYQFVHDCTFRRGWVESLVIPAVEWLAHHAALYWSPGQEMQCPGFMTEARERVHIDNCYKCSGTGRVPRPFVPTAQPITEVRLPTPPDLAEWPGGAGEPLGDFDARGGRFVWPVSWPGVTFHVGRRR